MAIAEAQGLMCAEEVVTERPMPGFDQAAIDGYAVRSVDVLGVGEVGAEGLPAPLDDSVDDARDGLVLPVMGTVEAGSRTPSRLQPRQAVRVQTGAPLPTLADAVLPLGGPTAGRSGCGSTGARPRAPTCAEPATTSSPATSRCAPER
ncbi:molybdenum cofactor biosynthesis moeA family protein [Mycobacterium avium subsp. avium 2285 (R)]|nr:molybdenum cofactor biosynthesis moeA family protein [Mycobacterium avium subsp. avium 2285 (R)]